MYLNTFYEQQDFLYNLTLGSLKQQKKKRRHTGGSLCTQNVTHMDILPLRLPGGQRSRITECSTPVSLVLSTVVVEAMLVVSVCFPSLQDK